MGYSGMVIYVYLRGICRGYVGRVFGLGCIDLSMDSQMENDFETWVVVVDRANMT